MSRRRKSKFDAISIDEGNRLRGKAVDMMRGGVGPRSEAQKSIDERRSDIATQRNDLAARKGLRQRDIRVGQGHVFRPNRDKGMAGATQGGRGLHTGLLEQVAKRRKSRPRTVFSPRG